MILAWLGIANSLVALGSCVHLLLHYRHPRSAVAWLFAIWTLPVVGWALYWLFAVYEGPRRIRHRRHRVGSAARRGRPARETRDAPSTSRLDRSIDRICPFPASAGHRVALIRPGGEAYDTMIDAIAAAREEVCIQTYILRPGALLQRLRDALRERAAAGVRVYLLADPIGSMTLGRSEIDGLERAGVRVGMFLAPNPLKRRFQINFRNHRKLLLVDRAVAFTGGRNWGDVVRRTPETEFRDVVVRVEGPTVSALHRVFAEDWSIATEDTALLDDPALPTELAGDVGASTTVRVIPDGPDEALEVHRLKTIFSMAIHSATESVLVVSPYFVPGPVVANALVAAALSGIDVRVLIAARSQSWLADRAARYYFDVLLESGVRIFLCREFLHAKALVIDGRWTTIGSTNFDQRSFALNYELNLEIVGTEFAEALVRSFEDDFAVSDEVDRDSFSQRGRWRRLEESVAALFEPLL